MKKDVGSLEYKASALQTILALFIATVCYILISPKWTIAIAAWIAPAAMLYFYLLGNFRLKFLWLFVTLYVTSLIAAIDVQPFPLAVLAVINIVGNLLAVIPFLLSKWAAKYFKGFVSTLIFPASAVALEYFNSTGLGGVWGSIANTQYSFAWLTQLVSVTGLWGISFLIYWFASVAVWVFERKAERENSLKGIIIFCSTLLIVLIFGAVRYTSNRNINSQTKVAGISVPVFSFMEKLYKDYSNNDIAIDTKISQSSPQLQQVNLALIPFIETEDTVKFHDGYNALKKIRDSLFALSKKAADEGAKIISWSEGNAFVFKNEEENFINRGKTFAADNHVYLLMAMATILPGKITADKNFVENKALLISPEGNVVNDFRKNHPVPFAEHSKAGDGKIPVIKTPYGNISTSICYDADFPKTMQQLSQNKTALLLLPAGDWYSIAPYHSYMAVFRAIENGTSLFRQTSGGLSIAVDYRGKLLAQKNFFDAGEKITIANISVQHVTTLYSIIGDAFAYACILFLLTAIIYLLIKTVARKQFKKKQKILNKTLAA